MITDLKSKVAYITGGSKGIGFGIADAMLEVGIKVAITGRNIESLNTAKNTLLAKHQGGEVLVIQSEVSSYASEQVSISKVLAHFGQLDVVIANAGVGHFASIDEMTEEQWNSTIDTNLTGVFNTAKSSIPALKESKGYFISIASLAGTNFFAKGAAYNASKFGLVGMTQAMMLDLRPFDIKVSTIMPGSVATYFNNNQPDENDFWKIQIEDIGELVIDLLKMNPRTLPSKIEVRPSAPHKRPK